MRQHGGAFTDSSDSEYYSESTGASDTGEDDRSTYIIPPTQSHILVKASKSPSFPKITVSAYQLPGEFVFRIFFYVFQVKNWKFGGALGEKTFEIISLPELEEQLYSKISLTQNIYHECFDVKL